MFKRPFEEVVNTKNLLEIERTDHTTNTEAYRVFPIKQETLLEEGWEYPEGENVFTNVGATPAPANINKFLIGKYEGNKWGGKYLRAPDIFFTILEKGNRYKSFENNGEVFIVEDITDILEEKL